MHYFLEMFELRPLHYVFKVNKRREAIELLKKLGMQVLRHEEFSEGCKATCNGAFDNRWSKSMVGFGSEDTHFVFEIVLLFNHNQNLFRLSIFGSNRCVTLTLTSARC